MGTFLSEIAASAAPIAATCALAGVLIAVSVIDLRTKRIPDWLNAGLALGGLVATWALGFSLVDAALGLIGGYAALAGLAYFYRTVRGVDGLGLGDAKLLGAAGAWVGWQVLPFVVLIAAALGLVFVAAQRLRGRVMDARDALAFGPFLSLGIFVAWLARVFVAA